MHLPGHVESHSTMGVRQLLPPLSGVSVYIIYAKLLLGIWSMDFNSTILCSVISLGCLIWQAYSSIIIETQKYVLASVIDCLGFTRSGAYIDKYLKKKESLLTCWEREFFEICCLPGFHGPLSFSCYC